MRCFFAKGSIVMVEPISNCISGSVLAMKKWQRSNLFLVSPGERMFHEINIMLRHYVDIGKKERCVMQI